VTSSTPYQDGPAFAAVNVADLESGSRFGSARHKGKEDIPHTGNNWVRYNLKERRILPTHYAIRTNEKGPGGHHLKSWRVETSDDGENWREINHKEDNEELNGQFFVGTFEVTAAEHCRFIRLVNIGKNHRGNDALCISGWEIFGTLIE
jgi:hypothetical protein